MLMQTKLRAAVGAAALIGFSMTTGGNAQQHAVHDCKPELIKATGKATLLGMGRARRLAIDNWQREVRQRYGERYMDYTHARGANFECESASIGTFGSLNKRCTVVGHPCAPGAPIEQPNGPITDGTPPTELVCNAQRALIRLRYLESDQLDCEFGPITSRAVRRFQRHNGLAQTGQLDRATLQRLFELTRGRVG